MTDKDSVQPCQKCGSRIIKKSIKDHEKHCSGKNRNISGKQTSQTKISTLNKLDNFTKNPKKSIDATRFPESTVILKKTSHVKFSSCDLQTNQIKTTSKPDDASKSNKSKSSIDTGTRNKVISDPITRNSSSKDIGLVKKGNLKSVDDIKSKDKNKLNRTNQLAKSKSNGACTDSKPLKSSSSDCDLKDRKNSNAQSKRISVSHVNKDNKEIIAKLEEDKPKSSVFKGTTKKTKTVKFPNVVNISPDDDVENSAREQSTPHPASSIHEEEEIVGKLIEDTIKPEESKCEEDDEEQVEIVIEKISQRKSSKSSYHHSCSNDPRQTRLRSEAAHEMFVEQFVVPVGQFAYEMHRKSLVPCIFCKRTFSPDRVQIHQVACIERPR